MLSFNKMKDAGSVVGVKFSDLLICLVANLMLSFKVCETYCVCSSFWCLTCDMEYLCYFVLHVVEELL